MKIQAIDLRESNRINLGIHAPLPAPLSMYIEPTSLCNLRCNFCPTGDMKLRQLRPNGTMNKETFSLILEDLKFWGREGGIKLKRINFYKDGEPLLNKDLGWMVRQIKEWDLAEQAWVKTNGLLLSPDMNQRLVESGLDFIGVSINAVDAAGYLRITSTRVDYKRLISGVSDLYTRRGNVKVYVKIADSGFTEEERQKFLADFCPISDNCAIEQLHGWSASDTKDWKLGTQPTTFEGYPLTDKIACPLPFFMMAVNWDGTVSPCNEDWMHGELLGDIRASSLREIWEGDTMKSFRLMHLNGGRGISSVCGNCDYLRTLPDNIDGAREGIKARL